MSRTIDYDGPDVAAGARTSAAALVACLASRPAAGGRDLARRSRGAEWLLVRADRVGELPPSWLRPVRPWRLIFSLRTRHQGGAADPSDPLRAEKLREAATGHDLVELEAPHDFTPEVLAAVPPGQRLVSWRGPATGTPALADRLRWLTGVEAAVYRLVVASRRVEDGIPPLEVLHATGRHDVVAYADGEAGLWSRALSPLLGAPFVFGHMDDSGVAGPTIGRLVDDFGLPDPGPVRMTFGIAGDPVTHSFSPRMHNEWYRASGVPALFLPFQVETFGPFWDGLVASGVMERLGLPLRGLTVASPNKESASSSASAVSRSARLSWSANLVYRRGGHWVADTTDPAGVFETLGRRGISVSGRRAAVVGCGGSGRAIASALARSGADVVLSNRSRPRGEQASRLLGLPLVELSKFSAADFDLIVNATPVGRGGEGIPFACDRLAPGLVVIDLVYATGPTPLVLAAKARGADVVEGHEVLLVQASRQFEKMTGKAVPVGFFAGSAGPSGAVRRRGAGPPGAENDSPLARSGESGTGGFVHRDPRGGASP